MFSNFWGSVQADALHIPIQERQANSSFSGIHSSKFIPTRVSHPCPICEDTKGKCRIVSTEFVLCMTYPTDAGLLGWRYLGETKGGYYAGKYIAIRAESELERQQRREEALKLKSARQKAIQKYLDQLPDTDQRDRQWQQYLNSLTLNDVDRDNLYRRGLTDQQITAIGFKSVTDGYITPIHNPQGQIIGAQLRKRNAVNEGRYRWHKPNGWDIHLPNGDVPLAFYLPFDSSLATPPQQVVLVEGTGVKPARTADLLNCPAIGAAGGNFTASKHELQAYLQAINVTPELTKIAIAPDAGDINNPAVVKRLQKTIALVKSLGYNLKVLWWGQFTKQDDDIDELDDKDVITSITPEEFIKLGQQQWSDKIQTLLGKLSPQPKLAQGFTVKSRSQEAISTYKTEHRLNTWVNAFKQGQKHLLDTSSTGTGKSFDAGRVTPDIFDARQVIYISDQHRNVTTATLQDWADLEARHGGLITDATGKTRRIKLGQAATVAANCGRTSVVAALRAKGVARADSDIICQTCPALNACRHSKGKGYGFKYERREALAKPRLRSHPASLPAPFEYDYSNVVLIWEEADANFTTATKLDVSVVDIDAVIVRLSLQAPELFVNLQPFLVALRDLLTGKQLKFGYDLQKLRELLPQASIDIDILKQVLQPDLSCLDTVDEIAESEFEGLTGKQQHRLAEVSRHLKQNTTLNSYEAEQRIEQEVLKQWLPEFLEILKHDNKGYAAVQARSLKLTLPNYRLRQIATASKFNIFLSATWSAEEAALALGCDDAQIISYRQCDRSQVINPEIIQISDLGRMGMDRGADQCKRLEILLEHYRAIDPSTQVIDFKKYQRDWVWWRDSRGLNDLASARTLIIVGTPCRNLLDLQAEYATLMGQVVNTEDEQFQSFVYRKILADVQQCFGRKMGARCQAGDKIVFISDFELDLPVKQVKALEVTPDAASKSERVQMGIKQAIAWLTDQGKKVTQKAIAEFLGMTREAISHYRKLIFLLLQTLYSKKIINAEPREQDVEICQDLAAVVAQVVSSDSPMVEILKAIHEIFFDWIPAKLQKGVLYYLDGLSQSRLLSYLAIVAMPTLHVQM